MPFDDNRGICVLTHTIVAIDEQGKLIKKLPDYLYNNYGKIQNET